MSNNGLKPRDIQTISEIFGKYSEIKKVCLFGSRAMQTHNFGSDIDFALMDSVSDKTLRNLKADFEESSLPYFVDLQNFNKIENTKLKEHIQRVGVPFYNA